MIYLSTIIFLVSYHTRDAFGLDYRINERNARNIRSYESYQNDLNNYISSMRYNQDELLVHKGKLAENVKTEGYLDDNKTFIVIKRERKGIYNSMADISILSSIEHRTYPGSLLLANYHLTENTPDFVSIARAPIKYNVYIPGTTYNRSFNIVPSFSSYQEAVDGVLKTWFGKHPKHQPDYNLLQSAYSFAHSKEQLRVKFGQAFKDSVVERNTDFSAVDKQEKLIMIQRYQQIFYTVSVNHSHRPGELFGAGVTQQELASKIDERNPPVMVDKIAYGRVYYVKIETTSTDKKAKDLMETKLTKLYLGIEPEADYKQYLKNFNMQVYVMGGGSDHVDLVNARNMKDVLNVISKYGKFNRDNVGYPMSYSSIFIKDNSRAVVKSFTEYTETTRTEHKKGIIKIKHTGRFTAQWKIEWDEVNYDGYGNKIVTRKGWDKNMLQLEAPFSAEIELSGNCENISVFAREVSFPHYSRVIVDLNGIPLVKERTFSISGNTFTPKSSIEPGV